MTPLTVMVWKKFINSSRYPIPISDNDFHCVGINDFIGVFPSQSRYLNSSTRCKRVTLLQWLFADPRTRLLDRGRYWEISRTIGSTNPPYISGLSRVKSPYRNVDTMTFFENFIRHRTYWKQSLWMVSLRSLTFVHSTGSRKKKIKTNRCHCSNSQLNKIIRKNNYYNDLSDYFNLNTTLFGFTIHQDNLKALLGIVLVNI